MELTGRQILILRGLRGKSALDVPAKMVDDHMDELIDTGYVTVRVIDDQFSYEITEDGRAALKRSDGGS